ncbi:transglycosylase [Streptomyces aurantiogriseus]|uniref:Transglycosylase n=2 Tax=Streptomyces aurantiogriseus TaxID=66870 RepID=A0A918KWN2_9ACTN|nr:transglycosylase [Streptomyces aurantiogriseus]
MPGQCGHSAEGQVQDMSIISWIILGLLAGVIAKVLLPGRDPGGFIGTTFIGIAGAFIGGWISARWLDHPITKDFYDGATWAAAIGGSLVLLIVYRIVFGHSRD